MNTLLVICGLAILSLCSANHAYAYSGNCSQYFTTTALPVIIASGTGACTPGAAASGYNMFKINVTVAATYYISLMTERDSKSSIQVNVYNPTGFVPATPCLNLVQNIGADAGTAVPHLNGIVWLTAGIYTAVVTTNVPEPSAIFVVHVDRVLTGALSLATGPWWDIPYSSSSGTTCSTTSSSAPYVMFTWMQATSGLFDLYGSAYNMTQVDATFALYNNTPTIGGNSSNPGTPCGANNAIFVGSWYVSSNVGAWREVNLTAGVNYTIVMSTYDTTAITGYIAYWAIPTAVGYLGANQNYLRPSLATYAPSPCVPDSSPRNWAVVTFQTTQNVYIIDNPSANSFDTAGCLYQGLNLGSADQSVPPTPCTPGWIGCSDTGDIAPLIAAGIRAGTNFTYVQTSYGSSSYANGRYAVFIYTGTPLPGTATTSSGVVTSTSTGAASGEMSSSSAASIAFGTLLAVAMLVIA